MKKSVFAVLAMFAVAGVLTTGCGKSETNGAPVGPPAPTTGDRKLPKGEPKMEKLPAPKIEIEKIPALPKIEIDKIPPAKD